MTDAADHAVIAQAQGLIAKLEAGPPAGACQSHGDLAAGVALLLRLEIAKLSNPPVLAIVPPLPAGVRVAMEVAKVTGWPLAVAILGAVWMILGMPMPGAVAGAASGATP